MAQDMPEPTFELVVSTFATQAAIALGQMPNPGTKEVVEDLDQAKFAIDLLQLLEEKTRGNLNEAEEKFLKNCLYQFRMVFIDKSAKQ